MDFTEMLMSILPTLLCGAITAIFGWLVVQVKKFIKSFEERDSKLQSSIDELKVSQKMLRDAQRNVIKRALVQMYQQALDKESISPLELEIFHRLAESYFALDGNTYIQSLVERMSEVPVKGEPIPEH